MKYNEKYGEVYRRASRLKKGGSFTYVIENDTPRNSVIRAVSATLRNRWEAGTLGWRCTISTTDAEGYALPSNEIRVTREPTFG